VVVLIWLICHESLFGETPMTLKILAPGEHYSHHIYLKIHLGESHYADWFMGDSINSFG
jgi:hypothetical protein